MNLTEKEKNRSLLFSSSVWEIFSTLSLQEFFFYPPTLLPEAQPESD